MISAASSPNARQKFSLDGEHLSFEIKGDNSERTVKRGRQGGSVECFGCPENPALMRLGNVGETIEHAAGGC